MTKHEQIQLNQLLEDQVKDQSGVNFISLIQAASNNNLSITAKYEPLDYKFMNAKESVEFDNFYYGISPLFNNDVIHDIIVKRQFKSPSDLSQYIEDNYKLFMLYEDSKRYIKPLHKKVILQAIHKFGIECHIDTEEVFLEIANKLFHLNNKIIKYTDKNSPIYLLGSISDQTLSHIKELGFQFSIDTNHKIHISKGTNPSFDFNDPTILDLNYKLCYGDAFYSGVMLKLMKITQLQNKYSNKDIDTIMLSVHRTTFFTEDAFDNHNQNDNGLLTKEDQNLICAFFKREDQRQRILINQNPLIDIESVNKYLKTSTFPNIIGVTGNITTLDNMLIVCKRGQKVEDSSTVYPSVNGHAEFYDQNVSFYKESAFEDVPTIIARTEARIDFIGEITRETTAELNVEDFKQKWQYLGLSVLGIKPYEGQLKRRFHFNILMQNKINHAAIEVISEHRKAIENYENEKLFMINLHVYQSVLDKIWSKLVSIIQWITKNKSMLGIFATIMTIILTTSLFRAQDTIEQTLFKTPFETAMLVFSLILTIKSFWNIISYTKLYYKNMKYINQINTDNTTKDIQSVLRKTKSKISQYEQKNVVLHPIAILMYSLYVNIKLNN